MKDRIKRLLPHMYTLWHSLRIKHNEKAEVEKKEAYDRYGMEVLKDLFSMTILKDYDVSCYYGTLLGLVRDDRLIPWDDDLDFIILNKKTFSWESFEKDMCKAGFWKYRTIEGEYGIEGQSYKKRNVLCDFFIKEPGNDVISSKYGCYELPEYNYINGKTALYQYWYYMVPQTKQLISKKIGDVEIRIPENFEEVLKAYYGDNWIKPDPNFSPKREYVELPAKITYHRRKWFII